MARTRSIMILAAGAALALWAAKGPAPAFLPAPQGRATRTSASAIAAPAALAMLGAAAPAHADAIGDAAKKLSSKAYPFLSEVNWNSPLALTKPGSGSAADYLKAIDKALQMGAAMDTKALKDGVIAHHKAIGSISSTGLTSQEDFTAINAAIGRMIASVPEEKTMAVYDAFSKVVSPEVPKYLMGTVKEADAKAAYQALMEFKDVVKANPTKAAVDKTTVMDGKGITEAAKELSTAAYPFLKEVDWNSNLALKAPGARATPQAMLKAIDKALVMGAAMDGAALKEATLAHSKAIAGIDAKGVPKAADFEAINAGLGKAIASVPISKVLDVYNAFGDAVSPDVPKYLMSSVKEADAKAAYAALMKFKDVVKGEALARAYTELPLPYIRAGPWA